MRQRWRAFASILGIISILVLLTGCGSGGEAATPVIAKVAFVRQANAVCKQTGEDVISEGSEVLQETEESSGKSGREAEAVFVPEWLIPRIETEIEELRELGVPDGDEDRVNAIYESLEEVLELAKSDPRRYLGLQANFKHPYREAEKLATAYGIPECGQP